MVPDGYMGNGLPERHDGVQPVRPVARDRRELRMPPDGFHLHVLIPGAM